MSSNFQIRKDSAFTLVDLIIATCAVLILVALALPLLVKTQEHASKTKCANNIRQIAIAGHNFHDAYKRLPPGILGHAEAVNQADWLKDEGEVSWKRTQHTSSLGMILPFMELQKVSAEIDPTQFNMYKFIDEHIDRTSGKPTYDWFGEIAGVEKTMVLQIKQFQCPSDSMAKTKFDKVIVCQQPISQGMAPKDDYAVKYGSDFDGKWKIKKRIGTTNYLACAGAFSGGRHPDRDFRGYTGMMSSRSRITLETVRDGTSNTIMYGETVGQIDDRKRTIAQSWFTSGLGRGRGHLAWGQKATDKTGPVIGNLVNANVYGFGSAHTEGAVFAFGDASVRSFKRNIDAQVFYAMCGSSDGRFDVKSKEFESPLVDFKVRPLLVEYRKEAQELQQEIIAIEVEKARLRTRLKAGLHKVAQIQAEKGNTAEVERANKEILKIDPNDAKARSYFKEKGTLEELLKQLKEQGYPKEPYYDAGPRRQRRGKRSDKRSDKRNEQAIPLRDKANIPVPFKKKSNRRIDKS